MVIWWWLGGCDEGSTINYTTPHPTTDDDLQTHTGLQGAKEYLDLKVPKYDDSTFKFWCYDTPGLINQEQVGWWVRRNLQKKKSANFVTPFHTLQHPNPPTDREPFEGKGVI